MARFRTFACELYPEDDSHMKILEYIITYFDYAYILHDKDCWEEESEEHHIGDLKKPHYHVILSFKNPRSIDKLKQELGLKHLETCNFYLYSRYLIHKDNPRKFQYNEREIVTNMGLRIHNALKRDYNSQEQDTRILIDYIRFKQSNGFCYLNDLIDFAMNNDCLLDLKKNITFYRLLVDDNIGFRRL